MTANESNLRPTGILDIKSGPVRKALATVKVSRADTVAYLQACHELIRKKVSPVYTVDELQSVSKTFEKQKGSCSQRFACLEALARAAGIGTRVRGLWIKGQFWAPRFPWTRFFIPPQVLLALPQFYVNDDWLDAEELFGSTETLARKNPYPFANDGESLFDAVSHVAIDFRGNSARCEGAKCSLSRFAIGEAGTFTSRDELFAAHPLFQKSFRGRVFELIYGGRKSV